MRQPRRSALTEEDFIISLLWIGRQETQLALRLAELTMLTDRRDAIRMYRRERQRVRADRG